MICVTAGFVTSMTRGDKEGKPMTGKVTEDRLETQSKYLELIQILSLLYFPGSLELSAAERVG